MTELVLGFKDLILTNFTQIWRLIIIPFMSLGLVYILGRLIPILKTDISKNILALLSMIAISWFTGKQINSNAELEYIIWDITLYTTLSSIIYVTICWHLYDRMDAYLDKKFGEDLKKKKVKKKKKIHPLKAIKK